MDKTATATHSRVAFVDHSYHKVTASSRFFIDMLREAHDVVELESDAWRGAAPITARDVDVVGADVAVFWQALPWPSELLKLRTPAIWVPMYDTAARRSGRLFWRVLRQRNVRIVSFCRALSRLATRHGVPATDCTYYPDPFALGEARCDGRDLRVFLWDRGEVGFGRLKTLLGDQKVAETIVRLAPDPGLRASRPSLADLSGYRVRLITGPLSREEHLRLLAGCNVFVAPRELEGIGLSNLEAMAMGLAVIAPDRPTMNEYISHGVNGYLYDPRRPHVIDLNAALDVGRHARADVSAGHDEWLAARPRLLAEAFAPFAAAAVPSVGTAAAARALTSLERAKGWIPPRPRAAVARALRAYRP